MSARDDFNRMIASIPAAGVEKVCSACHHRHGGHFDTFDGVRSGCTEMIPMLSAPGGTEQCICIGMDREDQ